MDTILNLAEKDERIRAVYMNGSRTNPNVKKEIFQDYDIVYVVKETKPFIEDEGWIDNFGEIAIFQEPDNNSSNFGMETNFGQSYGYLMLFKDGNRVFISKPKNI
ncbi:aminoglycoside 6-adenylyltransferase [Rossellomorea vietnamensis]